MRKLIPITLITALLLGGWGCTTVERQFQTVLLKKPEIVLKHCIDTYKPTLKEITEIERLVYDTSYVEIDCTDTLYKDRVVKAKCPPHEIVTITKEIEIMDTRVSDLLTIELDALKINHSILETRYDTNKRFYRWSLLGNILLGLLLIVAFKRK